MPIAAAPAATFASLTAQWPDAALAALQRLGSPEEILQWLEGIAAADWSRLRCPLSVLRDRRLNPLDGGFFAAAALRRLGFAPRLLAWQADESVFSAAVYGSSGRLGAIGWHADPRMRYRALRPRKLPDLLESYRVVLGATAVPARARLLHLRRHDAYDWITEDAAIEPLAELALALNPIC